MFEDYHLRRVRERALKDFAFIVDALAGAPNGDYRDQFFWEFVANKIASRHGLKTLFGRESSSVEEIIEEARRWKETPELLAISPRLYETLEDLAVGLSSKQAAKKRHVTENTVRTHRARLYKFLKVENAPEAVAVAFHKGLLIPACSQELQRL